MTLANKILRISNNHRVKDHLCPFCIDVRCFPICEYAVRHFESAESNSYVHLIVTTKKGVCYVNYPGVVKV